jgi:transposase InsO family protein
MFRMLGYISEYRDWRMVVITGALGICVTLAVMEVINAYSVSLTPLCPSDLTGLFWTKRCEKTSLGAWVMPKKMFSAEQIVTLLRQIEVLMAQGKSAPLGLPGRRDIAAELRDELLNGEIFYSLKEAQIVIEQWRKHYNTIRPHSALSL